MSEWQPIETAPKDGTIVLVCRPEAGVWKARVFLSYWYDSVETRYGKVIRRRGRDQSWRRCRRGPFHPQILVTGMESMTSPITDEELQRLKELADTR